MRNLCVEIIIYYMQTMYLLHGERIRRKLCYSERVIKKYLHKFNKNADFCFLLPIFALDIVDLWERF